MSVRESEAIVLRTYPLGEADRLVSFLSRTEGRLRGVARGARRPKSRFGSTLEPLSHIRIWYFERETRELVRIQQCELIESFFGAQQNFEQGLALGLMCEVTEAVLPEREASDASFRLLLHVARGVCGTGKIWLPLEYFALWTVRLAGWLPDLTRCARCGKRLLNGRGHVLLSRSGIACDACAHPGMRSITAAGLNRARAMLEERLDHLYDRPLPGESRELLEYLLDVIEHQIERKLKTRKLLETA
jgi:DNA repair protein RecO (recombination protein O)